MTGIAEGWITVWIRGEALWINFGINIICCFEELL